MKLFIAVSTAKDGNMVNQENRKKFLESHDLDMDDMTLVKLKYDSDNYCRYFEVSQNHTNRVMPVDDIVTADALLTKTPDQVLFLPLADCIGAVYFDAIKEILMLSHLGRHNLEQFGGKKSIKFMASEYGCNPSSIKVWLSPAAGGDNYPLFAFDNTSLQDVAVNQLVSAGIKTDNITLSSVDTTSDLNYFSHSEFLKGNRKTDGRFAIFAVMKK